MAFSEEGLSALKAFFKDQQGHLPAQVRLGPGTTITDVRLFIKTQFEIIDQSSNGISGQLAFDRLTSLHQALKILPGIEG